MNDREWQTKIKQAIEAEPWPELSHDLWPRMEARLAARRPAPPVWDLLLLAAILAIAVAFPDMLLNMLYHL